MKNTCARLQKLPGTVTVGVRHRLLAGTVFFALLAVLGSPLAQAEEGGKLTLDKLVAPDTLLFVKCSGVDEFKKYSEQLDLVRLWAHPEFQAFFADAKAMLPQMLGAGPQAEFPIKPVWDLFKGNFMAAMSPHLAIFEEGAMPTPVVAMDMTGKQEAFMGTINNMMKMLAEQVGLKMGQKPYRGFEINYIGLPEKRLTICYTPIQNLFVATFNAPYLQNIIDRHLDKKPCLASVTSFKTCLRRVHAQAAGLAVYLNVKPLLNAVKPFCPFELIDCLNAEGFAGIDALCFATSIEKGGARDSLFIHCPGKKKGLLKALFPHPVSKKNLAMVPPNAVLFWDFVFDPELLMQEVDGFVEHYIPELYSQFRYEIECVRKELGIDLETELLAPLGSEITFFVTMPMMLSIPDLVLTVELDDEPGFIALLDKLQAMAAGEVDISETKYDGSIMRHLIIPEAGVPFSPTFMVRDGKLFVTGSPTSLMNYMNWLKKGEPGLAATEGFKTAMAGVPDNVTCLEYLDLRSGAEFGYNMAQSFMPALIAESNLPFDIGKLPMTETVKSHISNAASFSTADEDGILMSGYWPLGTAALLGMAVSGVDYLITHDLLMGLVAQAGGFDGGPSRSSNDLVQKGVGLSQSGEHEKAIQVLSKWIDNHPNDRSRGGTPWMFRGFSKLSLKRYAEGIEDYKVAAAVDTNSRGLAYYNICCGYSCLNEADKAIEYLEKAVEAGWYDSRYLNTDSDLDNIRNDERFKAILNKQV